ncbi:hypothetical protein [Gluconobacter oxydans]|uniref:hypothetical protein n=1 Tax=Gluconobacter oxydans TaxID=442 RepID=UPI0039E838EB
MGIAVTTVFSIFGQKSRLLQIATERAYRTCAPEQIAWENDTTLVMTLESGIGTSFLGHGLGLSDEYPDVSIRGMEYLDCCDDPTFAKWEAGELVYEAELTTEFSILFPTDPARNWSGAYATFWHRSPTTAAAISDSCPHFDLMHLSEVSGPVSGWAQTTDGSGTLFLRLPSSQEAQDGTAVILSAERQSSTVFDGVDRLGGFARCYRSSYGKIAGRHPELREVLRSAWKVDAKKRRRIRRERNVIRRKVRKESCDGSTNKVWFIEDDLWGI